MHKINKENNPTTGTPADQDNLSKQASNSSSNRLATIGNSFSLNISKSIKILQEMGNKVIQQNLSANQATDNKCEFAGVAPPPTPSTPTEPNRAPSKTDSPVRTGIPGFAKRQMRPSPAKDASQFSPTASARKMIEQIFLAAESQTTKPDELSSNPCSSRSTSESSSGAESTDEFVPSEASTKSISTDDTTFSKATSASATNSCASTSSGPKSSSTSSSKERLSTETSDSISSLSGGSSLSGSNSNSHENSPTKTPMKGDTVPFSFGPASAVRDQRRVIARQETNDELEMPFTMRPDPIPPLVPTNSTIEYNNNNSKFQSEIEIPRRLEYLLDMPEVPFAEQATHGWNPDDRSLNIFVKELDPLTLHRHPVAQSTDCIRTKRAYDRGIHLWELTWNPRQRGTHAIIGMSEGRTQLHCVGYQSLIGSGDESWGWDLGRNRACHNTKNTNIPPPVYPKMIKADETFTVPEKFMMCLDMDAIKRHLIRLQTL